MQEFSSIEEGTKNGHQRALIRLPLEPVSFVIKHKRYAVVNASVTLKGNRTRGSFSGTVFGGGAVSGTFSCSQSSRPHSQPAAKHGLLLPPSLTVPVGTPAAAEITGARPQWTASAVSARRCAAGRSRFPILTA